MEKNKQVLCSRKSYKDLEYDYVGNFKSLKLIVLGRYLGRRVKTKGSRLSSCDLDLS